MPSKGTQVIDVKCTYDRESDAAWLVCPDGHGRNVWVPKSMAEIDPPEPSKGDNVTITLEPGFAEHIGLV